MNIYHNAVNMKRFLVFIGILAIIPFLYVQTGQIQPYSATNPITPKRLDMQVRHFVFA